MAAWHRRLPPLATLAPFEAACRLRNFTRAGEELHYSQATISRRIGELEAFVGSPLFERGRHDVQPTAEAEALADAVRSAFGDLASSVDGMLRRASAMNRLVVFTDLSLATTLVAPIIGDFRRDHPGLDIRLLSSFEPIAATTADFDVGLQYGRDEPSGLVVEPIADDVIFPVCSPQTAAGLGDLTADDLARLPLLHVDYDEPAWTDWREFLASVATADVNAARAGAEKGLTFTSYQVCLDVAERGEGIALGWGHTVQPRIDAGRLVRLSGFELSRPGAICAYRPPALLGDARVDAFVASVKDRLGGDG